MQTPRFFFALCITALPILCILGIKSMQQDTTHAVYTDTTHPKEVTFVIMTNNPIQSKKTIQKAQIMYNNGIETTIILEGEGVLLLLSPEYAMRARKQHSVAHVPTPVQAVEPNAMHRPPQQLRKQRVQRQKKLPAAQHSPAENVPSLAAYRAAASALHDYTGIIQACPVCMKRYGVTPPPTHSTASYHITYLTSFLHPAP
ncbi:MAG: hypothetical protein MI749_15910 [Desulfovibrionales bacterium]|nr:hypothetical protein [Desulfovibrionales bacterium]